MSNIAKNMEFLLQGRTVEVRAMHPKRGTVSGYYCDYGKLARDLYFYNKETNIFFTMNKIDENLKARSYNRFKEFSKVTTKDDEIVERCYILIDLDPVRPSGVSATDIEHENALALAQRIRDDLIAEGFNCIIRADSGSGAHLLIPIKMPNNEESTKLVKRFLETLDKIYSTNDVVVDTTTSNAARITKVYGSRAIKGDNMPERPHRTSEILEDIDNFEIVIVPTNVITAYVEKYGSKIQKGKRVSFDEIVKENTQANNNAFNVEEWVNKHGFKVTKEKRIDNGYLYQVYPCMFQSNHDDDSGMFIIQYDSGFLYAGCHHSKCEGKSWDTLWTMYEKKRRNPNMKVLKETKKDAQQDKSLADIILDIVNEKEHDIFKNQYQDFYVSIPELNNMVVELEGSYYMSYLISLYFKKMNVAIKKEHVKTAVDVLKATEMFSTNVRFTFKRLGSLNGSYLYNLNDEEQRIVLISKNEFNKYEFKVKKQDNEAVFIKNKMMKEQVAPCKDKILDMTFVDLMKKYYGILDQKELILHNVLLCYRLLHGLTQPIAMYIGEKGSGKTSLANFDAKIINPAINNVIAKPKTAKDWYAVLNSSDLIVVDNVSKLTNEETDILCMACQNELVSSLRKLYTNDELITFNLYTAIYLTSVKLTSYQTDLLDRCIFFHTKRLDSTNRKEENKFKKEFESDLSNIVTLMFKIVVDALNIMEEAEDFDDDEYIIRITSFQKYGTYLALAMGYSKEEFLDALECNSKDVQVDLASENGFVDLVKSFVEDKGYIKATATEILGQLNRYCEYRYIPKDHSLKYPNTFGRKLREYKSALLAVGILFEESKTSGSRLIELSDIKGVNKVNGNEVNVYSNLYKNPLAKCLEENVIDDINFE